MDRTTVLRFTDSWGLTWWVFEERCTRSIRIDDRSVAIREEHRLCFSTDMVTRVLDSCPDRWWRCDATRLEALCAYASPSHVHRLPHAAADTGPVPRMEVVSAVRQPPAPPRLPTRVLATLAG